MIRKATKVYLVVALMAIALVSGVGFLAYDASASKRASAAKRAARLVRSQPGEGKMESTQEYAVSQVRQIVIDRDIFTTLQAWEDQWRDATAVTEIEED